MTGEHDNPSVVHVVGAPSHLPGGQEDLGRWTPVALCAHACNTGVMPAGRVILVGDRSSEESARLHGLPFEHRVCLPVRKAALGRSALSKVAGGAERIICWNDELGPLVRGMAEDIDLVSSCPERFVGRARSLARVVVLTEHDLELWASRGVRAQLEPDLIPKVAPARLLSRKVVRTQLEINPDEFLLTTVGDQPSECDARGLAFLLTILSATGYPVAGVVPSASRSIGSALRHLRGVNNSPRLFLTDQPTESLLSGCDAIIDQQPNDAGSSAVLHALASAVGLRVIGLSHSGRAGLRHAPGAAAPILEILDELMIARGLTPPEPGRPAELAHA